MARKRAEGCDDLTSALIETHDQSDRLTEDELVSMLALLLSAGHETTVNLLGSSVLALLDRKPVTVGDVTTPAGEAVALSLAAANRDPAHFLNGEEFDITAASVHTWRSATASTTAWGPRRHVWRRASRCH